MNVKRMYHELLTISVLLNFFDSMLTGLAAFSVSYFLIYFYRIDFRLSFMPAIVFFIWSLYRKIKTNKILLLEKKFPKLRERLRTSFDNQEQHTTISNALHEEILLLMKKVDVNAFLSSKKLFIKITAICILLTSSTFLASIGFDVTDVTRAITESAPYRGAKDFAQSIFDPRQQKDDRLTDPRLLDLGRDEMNVTIETFNTELDINDIQDPEKNDYGGHYPEEIEGAAQESYDQGIPEEHKDVIKEYFKKIHE